MCPSVLSELELVVSFLERANKEYEAWDRSVLLSVCRE